MRKAFASACRISCGFSSNSWAKSAAAKPVVLTVLAAATMAIPSLAHAFHAPAAAHSEALSLVCAGVLLALFLLTLPSFLRSAAGEKHEPARWSTALTAIVLGLLTTSVKAGFDAAYPQRRASHEFILTLKRQATTLASMPPRVTVTVMG